MHFWFSFGACLIYVAVKCQTATLLHITGMKPAFYCAEFVDHLEISGIKHLKEQDKKKQNKLQQKLGVTLWQTRHSWSTD